jgi:small GTP-binding protein
MQAQQYTAEERYNHIHEAVGELITQGENPIQEEHQQNPKDTGTNDLVVKMTDCRNKWNEQRFQIAVLALVKAGKSTLINSWLGNEYMPASHIPETARVVRVKHAPSNQQGTLTDRDRPPVHGAAAICDYLRKLNEEVRTQGTMPDEDELVLEASLVALENSALGKQSFEILDTPGPNEAGTNLKEKIEKLLDKVDVIIYLLDYTKLNTSEEAEMFAKLREVRLDLLNSERLFFVVNKVDVLNRDAPPVEKTADYITKVLKKQIPGLTITPERILFISAEEALLARLVETGQASSKALKDFSQKVFGILADEEHPLEECQLRAPILFKRSRMHDLETTILASIYARKGIILLESILGDLDRHIRLFYSYLQIKRGTLLANQDELKNDMSNLENQLDAINKQLEQVTRQTVDFQKGIEDFLQSEFASFQQQVNNKIYHALSPQSAHRSNPSFFKLLPGFHIFDKFVSNITGWLTTSSRDKQQVENAIQKINEELADYLVRDLQRFLQELSEQLQQKQLPFFDTLRQKVADLSKEVEAVVGKTLQIDLLPVSVVFEPPAHIPLDEAIEVGVKTTNKTERDSYDEKYVAYKILWMFPVHKTRTVYYTRDVTTHEVDTNAIQQFWQEQISSEMKKTEEHVDEKFNKEIRATIELAEQELRSFSDNYVAIIKNNMAEASQGEQQRQKLLEQVEQRLQQMTELLKKIADYRGVLDQLKAAS